MSRVHLTRAGLLSGIGLRLGLRYEPGFSQKEGETLGHYLSTLARQVHIVLEEVSIEREMGRQVQERDCQALTDCP